MSEVQVLKFEEAAGVPPDLIPWDEEEGQALDAIQPDTALWQRLESYIAHRWSARQVVWTCDGPGDFHSHLSPTSNYVIDQWDDTTKTWETAITEQTALGFYLPRSCVYRVTATCGDTQDPVPQIVVDAYLRLAAYMVNAADMPSGASSHSYKIGDGIDESTERSISWAARALQYSGSADLLRGYRTA